MLPRTASWWCSPDVSPANRSQADLLRPGWIHAEPAESAEATIEIPVLNSAPSAATARPLSCRAKLDTAHDATLQGPLFSVNPIPINPYADPAEQEAGKE